MTQKKKNKLECPFGNDGETLHGPCVIAHKKSGTVSLRQQTINGQKIWGKRVRQSGRRQKVADNIKTMK